MSAPTVTPTRTPTDVQQIPADDGLALLLDLFALEPVEGPHRPAGGRQPAGPRARVQHWTRRAALWGAGPQGAWRAW
ncbi:hypothetical protein [Geodermatophilus poikilotrophus]|uniref:Uncharacterized protein n=1 Tax=Geodermatophilus poikilotrophus TaxID=1333667 RepID=A0A1I0IN63_9ACTN|nr:hypothetical protein [Geodermatophilus poikilotrophus]SET98511.1 hypothetical protein SAMN04488546_4546 [Geodermatophilus poikilotrophus]